MIVNLVLGCKYISYAKNMWFNKQKPSKCEYFFLKLFNIVVILQIIGICGFCDGAIKSVNMVVDPVLVLRSKTATIKCIYDLDKDPLYSVKFYRGAREIYRFSPTENPNKKIFPFPGINVDSTKSSSSQVVLRNVGFGLSGNFSCEVTCDAPSFSTKTATVQMQVVELPNVRPTIWTEQTRYEPGDILKANCSTPPSKPKTDLIFSVNNVVVYTGNPQYIPTSEGLFATKIEMILPLHSGHFGLRNSLVTGHANLIVRCTAKIGNFYNEFTEVDIGFSQKDPIPARVTSSYASIHLPTTSICICIIAFLINLCSR